MSSDLPSPDYLAGILDSLGRVRFHFQEDMDEAYTTRCELRIKTRENEMIEAIIGTLLDAHEIDYVLYERERSGDYFSITSFAGMETIRGQIAGKSSQLIRELDFVLGPYTGEFDSQVLDPETTCKLLLSRDELYFGWQPTGRWWLTPEEIAEDMSVDLRAIEPLRIPVADFRSDYTTPYIAGIVDALAKITARIYERRDGIGYGLNPALRIYRGGVHPAFAASVDQYCSMEDLPYSSQSGTTTLNTQFIGVEKLYKMFVRLGPHLLARYEEGVYLAETILPRIEDGALSTKQGFYDVLCAIEKLAGDTMGDTRRYTLEYFKNEWADDIDVVGGGS